MLADGCEAALRSLPLTLPDDEAKIQCVALWNHASGMGNFAKADFSRSEVELVVRAFVGGLAADETSPHSVSNSCKTKTISLSTDHHQWDQDTDVIYTFDDPS
ncbi:MAG: hypothetical protein CM15mP77_2430 [Synechococcus sp.]|nr:MAG: hypothetical protein CM15mP77_2430 [Synechococcus sp.]